MIGVKLRIVSLGQRLQEMWLGPAGMGWEKTCGDGTGTGTKLATLLATMGMTYLMWGGDGEEIVSSRRSLLDSSAVQPVGHMRPAG